MTTNKALKTIGLLGGGVIGGGWAARFVLNGYDVKIYDVDPQAKRKIGEVMANARRAYAKLTLAPLPLEGKITFVDTPEEAVTGVDFVQESAPERVELKQELLARASRVAPADVVFGSSTSGILPTQLQRDMSDCCVTQPSHHQSQLSRAGESNRELQPHSAGQKDKSFQRVVVPWPSSHLKLTLG